MNEMLINSVSQLKQKVSWFEDLILDYEIPNRMELTLQASCTKLYFKYSSTKKRYFVFGKSKPELFLFD